MLGLNPSGLKFTFGVAPSKAFVLQCICKLHIYQEPVLLKTLDLLDKMLMRWETQKHRAAHEWRGAGSDLCSCPVHWIHRVDGIVLHTGQTGEI